MKRLWGLGAVLLVIMLGAAACGGGGANVSSATNRQKKHVPAAASTPVTVMVADSPLGKILVDADGHTLYLFDQDTATTSACTGACATLWPPLIVSGAPRGSAGVDAAKVGVLATTAGSQVTYAGHPLHTFANDHAPGDVTGQGFAGLWWVIGADGQKITTPTPTVATPAPTTSAPSSPPPTPAPASLPAQTSPPETMPPATAPPTPQPTKPPMPQPPATTSPGNGGVGF